MIGDKITINGQEWEEISLKEYNSLDKETTRIACFHENYWNSTHYKKGDSYYD